MILLVVGAIIADVQMFHRCGADVQNRCTGALN